MLKEAMESLSLLNFGQNCFRFLFFAVALGVINEETQQLGGRGS